MKKTPPKMPAKPTLTADTPQDDQSRALRILLQPEAMAAMTSCMALPQIEGQPFDPHAFCEELKHITRAVADGDISHLERLAVSQAVTLNFIFNRLSTAALDKLNQPEFDSLLRLAFRAQSQSARTMETYAALKNPAVFTKQLNVASQQVVNNGPISPPPSPPAALPESTPIVRLAESKILTPEHERMD